MGIELKDLRLLACKLFENSMRFGYGCVQNYPLISVLALAFLVSYMFLPSVLEMAVYTSLVLACSTLFLKIHLSSKRPKDQNENENQSVLDRSDQGGVTKKSKFDGGFSDLETEAEEEDEEDMQEEASNVVKWTEDDQENLKDLKDSDLERNIRLQNVIAERKFNKKRSVFGKQSNAPVYVSRLTNLKVLATPNHPSLPNSAASMPLPMQNLYGVRRNFSAEQVQISGDSFRQGSNAAQQKHENSSAPSSPMESDHDQRFSKFDLFLNSNNRPGFARYRTRSDMGRHDQLIEQLLYRETEPLSHFGNTPYCGLQGDHILMKVNLDHNRNTNNDSISTESRGKEMGNDLRGAQEKSNLVEEKTDKSSGSSSEEIEEFFNGGNVSISTVSEDIRNINTHAQQSLSCSASRKSLTGESLYNSNPTADNIRYMEDSQIYSDKGPFHTPSRSVASDLVVEVSELGSPPPAYDEESISCDGENEKENILGSEGIWEDSSHIPGAKEIESKGGMKLNLSELHKCLEESTEFFTPRQEAMEKGSINLSSHSSSRNDLLHKIHSKNKQVMGEGIENAHHLAQKLIDLPPNDFSEQDPKGSDSSRELSKPAEESYSKSSEDSGEGSSRSAFASSEAENKNSKNVGTLIGQSRESHAEVSNTRRIDNMKFSGKEMTKPTKSNDSNEKLAAEKPQPSDIIVSNSNKVSVKSTINKVFSSSSSHNEFHQGTSQNIRGIK